MIHRRMIIAGVLLLLPAAAAMGATTTTRDPRPGVLVVDYERIDQLIDLKNRDDISVVSLESKDPHAVSDAHIQSLRSWLQSGGVLHVSGEGLDSGLVQSLVPTVVIDDYDFHKTTSGKRGGELLVRGTSPRLKLSDHELMDGVDQLYVYPTRKFDATPNAVPLVDLTDARGNHGVVLAAVPLGKGFVVLDGTARGKRLFFGRLEGFDEAHPNCIEQDGVRNCYDWERFWANMEKAGGGKERSEEKSSS